MSSGPTRLPPFSISQVSTLASSFADDVRAYVQARFVGVHVDDWREPTRGWADRVLPGDGIADLPAVLGALERAGWDGFYDLEIFSDNGTFGTAYPDSLWDVQPEELSRRSRESFRGCWEELRVAAEAAAGEEK